LKGKAYQEAADQAERAKKGSDDDEEAEAKPTKAALRKAKAAVSKSKSRHVSPAAEPDSPQGKASKTSSGLVPEVVITRRSPHGGSSPSSPPEDSEEEQQQRPRRGATGRRPIVVESDDDESEPPKPSAKKTKGKGAKASKVKGKKSKGSEESDFRASSGEESDDAESLDEFEASDDSAPKPKTKKPPAKKSSKKAGKAKASAPTSESEADLHDMDVDEPANKKKAPTKTGKKRKAEDDGGQPAKKKKRLLADPWKLGSRAVMDDFRQMRCPPLEMFRFARIVVDEYTYLDGIVYAMVSNLCGDRQWVLSGTPPIHDFAAVKTIAAFLKIHLGVDDISEGQAQDVKKRQKDLTSKRPPHFGSSHGLTQPTGVEKFHSFREVHSPEWHAHRLTVGQRFLDQFVRQVCF
jgi:hypothetical protein